MNPSYSISKPCSEDWNKMTAEEQGRHCQVCCKTVVDFSNKTNTEIVGFLKSNSGNRICGRFRKEQLIPQFRTPRPTSRYRTFFAALIFVFGGMLFSSCASNHDGGTGGHELMGDVAYTPDSLRPKNNTVDSTPKKTATPDSVKKSGVNKKKHTRKSAITLNQEPIHMMGDVAYTPDTLK